MATLPRIATLLLTASTMLAFMTAFAPTSAAQDRQPDTFVVGTVRDDSGNPVANAPLWVSYYPVYTEADYACAEPMPATEPAPPKEDPATTGTGAPASPADQNMTQTSSGATTTSYGYGCASPPYWGGSNETRTDAQGNYRAAVVSGSQVNVNLQLEGYTPGYAYGEAGKGELRLDLTVLKVPDKTARVEGRIVDADGQPIAAASLSVRNAKYGGHECSQNALQDAAVASDERAKMSIMPYPYGFECAIKIRADGTFEADVLPGYSVVAANGDYERHYAWTRSLDLPAGETTRVDIVLRERPAPDAIVQGYIVDQATGKAIPGASVSFSNLDASAWGSAHTDADGSYRIQLRSGMHMVSVYAPDHFDWQGMLDIEAGTADRDIELTPGQDQWGGGCCWAMKAEMAYDAASEGAPARMEAPAPTAGMATSSPTQAAGGSEADGMQAASNYADLGGGLGPYDPSQREDAGIDADGESDTRAASGLVVVGTAAALVGLALWRRK